MIKKSQLKELLGHLVREVMSEMVAQDPTGLGDTTEMPITSPTQQAKARRDQRTSIDTQIKQEKLKLKGIDDKLKSDKTMVDKAKRIDRPQSKDKITMLQKQKVGL